MATQQPSLPPHKTPEEARHLGHWIVAAMAGGLLTLVVEFIFGMYRKFSLLASFTGFLLVATLLAVTILNLIPRRWWGNVKLPSIPRRLRPFLFEAGLVVGFLFGWLRW